MVNMNILQLKKYYLLIKGKLQNKFIDSALGNTFEKQAKKNEEQGTKLQTNKNFNILHLIIYQRLNLMTL